MSQSMTTHEKIYRDYRAAIRLMRKSENGGGRTAERKQRALKATADKHGVRIREVKQIVRDQDAVNGVVHEHPRDYLVKLETDRALAAAIADNGGTEYGDKCVECGTEDKNRVIRIRLKGIHSDLTGDVQVSDPTCYPCYAGMPLKNSADDLR